jgi:hypothetical protein
MIADALAVTRGLALWGYAGSGPHFLYIHGALLAIPFLLIISRLQHRLMKLRIATFITQICAEPTPRGIESALRRTLADPRLTLHFWSAENDDFVNVDEICSWSDEAGDQMVVDLPRRDGSPLARASRSSRRRGTGRQLDLAADEDLELGADVAPARGCDGRPWPARTIPPRCQGSGGGGRRAHCSIEPMCPW